MGQALLPRINRFAVQWQSADQQTAANRFEVTCLLKAESAHGWTAAPPADLLHVLPGLDGVVLQHPSLALRLRRVRPHPAIGAENHPLTMSGGETLAEPHQQLLITIHQPTIPAGLQRWFIGGEVTVRHAGKFRRNGCPRGPEFTEPHSGQCFAADGQQQLGDQLGEQSGGSQPPEEQKRGQHGRPNRWLSLIGHPLDLHLILRN